MCERLLLCGLLVFSAWAQAARDPTQPEGAVLPVTAGRTAEPALQEDDALEFVRVDAGVRVAIIAGQALREGEKFRGFTVRRIGDSWVSLVAGRKQKVIRLYQGIADKAVSTVVSQDAGKEAQ